MRISSFITSNLVRLDGEYSPLVFHKIKTNVSLSQELDRLGIKVKDL